MSGKTRRDFFKGAALLGTSAGCCSLVGGMPFSHFAAAQPAENPKSQPAKDLDMTWLGGQAPLVAAGVSWGVPWVRGTLRAKQPVTAFSSGRPLPTQTWPLAYWPDGSIKWTGMSIAAAANSSDPIEVKLAPTVAPDRPVRVVETAQTVEVTTGPLICRMNRGGTNLIESIDVDGPRSRTKRASRSPARGPVRVRHERDGARGAIHQPRPEAEGRAGGTRPCGSAH